MVRTMKHHIWKLRALVQPSGHQPSRSGRSKPYYGNYVQQKCNCPDARATQSGRGLVMEAFSATLERRLQLTVRTLGQAVWYFGHNFLLKYQIGTNLRHWKANKKYCLLMVRTAIRIVWTEALSVRTTPTKIREFFKIAFWTQKQLPVQTAKATVRTRVPETPFLTRIRASKAYK
jgi:hypothetical protein